MQSSSAIGYIFAFIQVAGIRFYRIKPKFNHFLLRLKGKWENKLKYLNDLGSNEVLVFIVEKWIIAASNNNHWVYRVNKTHQERHQYTFRWY